MRHQRAHYGSIAWGAGKDDCVSYATCRARWNFLGSKWPDAARQITTLCKFRFSLSLSLLLPSSRGDSRERRFTIHLGPGEEKKEKEWTRHGIFFGRDRTGPKYGRPFEGREAAWRRNMLWPFLSFLFIFWKGKEQKEKFQGFETRVDNKSMEIYF